MDNEYNKPAKKTWVRPEIVIISRGDVQGGGNYKNYLKHTLQPQSTPKSLKTPSGLYVVGKTLNSFAS